MRKKILSIVLSMAMVMTMMGGVAFADGGNYGIGNPAWNGDVATWDCVYFGNYYYDFSEDKEPIKWRVLSVNGSEALLLADKNLDSGVNYYDKYESVTWEGSTLRAWVNGYFIGAAFTPSEQKAIVKKTIKNDNGAYGTAGGNDTQDKVFLLSIAEASNSAYGFSAPGTRTVYNTTFTGGWSYLDGTSWWLRTPGRYADRASYVDSSGAIQINGAVVQSIEMNQRMYGIRPALYIDLSKNKWKYAGTVSSDGSYCEPIDQYAAELSTYTCTYTGKQQLPAVTVGELVEDEDFEVVYYNNINTGVATVAINGIGNYKGKIYLNFDIVKATPKVTVTSTAKTVKYSSVKKKDTYTSAVAVTGANLKHLREEKGLSVKQVKEYLRVTEQAVYKYESGKGYPQTDTMFALMELYDAELHDIIDNHENILKAVNVADKGIPYWEMATNVISFKEQYNRSARYAELLGKYCKAV